ncbi:Hsp20/alpha crystallin family protein [Desulfovibrio sp. OttesenSCG-928-O18]|nr:Hsp20/alpha crystallin family protein [Desulfovibrio sp. OttesenSCG-928-O18]
MPSRLPLIYGLPSLLDRLMDQEDHAPFPAPENGFGCYPPLQLFEDGDAVYLRAAIAGASLENVNLVFNNNILVLRGMVPAPEGRQVRRERPTGPFRREVRLPCKVVPGAIRAVMRDGLLTVTMPKDPRAKKRAIPVCALPGEEL